MSYRWSMSIHSGCRQRRRSICTLVIRPILKIKLANIWTLSDDVKASRLTRSWSNLLKNNERYPRISDFLPLYHACFHVKSPDVRTEHRNYDFKEVVELTFSIIYTSVVTRSHHSYDGHLQYCCSWTNKVISFQYA